MNNFCAALIDVLGGRRRTANRAQFTGPTHVVRRNSFNQEGRLPVTLPECHAGGGTYSGVDLNDLTALLDRMGNRT